MLYAYEIHLDYTLYHVGTIAHKNKSEQVIWDKYCTAYGNMNINLNLYIESEKSVLKQGRKLNSKLGEVVRLQKFLCQGSKIPFQYLDLICTSHKNKSCNIFMAGIEFYDFYDDHGIGLHIL